MSWPAALVFAAPRQARAEDPTHSRQQIQQVIETLHLAHQEGQGNFLQLFLKDDISWTGVTLDPVPPPKK